MRRGLPTLLLLACLAAPLEAQSCKKVAPPFLASLVPERVADLPVEFSTDPGGGCRTLYRPENVETRAFALWAVVTVEGNANANLGESAEEIRAKFASATTPVLTMSDWPVVFSPLDKGDEYVAIKGSVKVTVLVKNGDHGSASEALASQFFAKILPKIPCG
jgi:hypothetical protein